jgi:hypothetical protein
MSSFTTSGHPANLKRTPNGSDGCMLLNLRSSTDSIPSALTNPLSMIHRNPSFDLGKRVARAPSAFWISHQDAAFSKRGDVTQCVNP